MASPEATIASAEAFGSPDGVLQDLTGPLQGWKKKFPQKKGGTPKRKDVSYIAPDGEELKSKRQLDKYLKAHPKGPTASDFDWNSGETPRRSARLSSKGRLSSDSMEAEAEPVTKRSKRLVRENAKDSASPVTTAKGRKTEVRELGHVAIAGNDEVMHEADMGEETAVLDRDAVMLGETQQSRDNEGNEEADEKPTDGKDVGDAEDAGDKKGAEVAADDPKTMDVDEPDVKPVGTNVDVPVVEAEETKVVEPAAKPEDSTAAVVVESSLELEEAKKESSLSIEKDVKDPAAKPSEPEVVVPAIEASAETDVDMPAVAVEEPVNPSEPQPMTESKFEEKPVEGAAKEQDNNLIIEELVEEEKANGVNVDPHADETPLASKEGEIKTKVQVDPPQPQGIHALVDGTATFGGGAKPQEEVPPAPGDGPQSTVAPVGIST